MLARSTKSQRDGTESLSRQDETRVLHTAVLTPHDAPHGLDETNESDEQDDMHEVDVTAADALLNGDSSDESEMDQVDTVSNAFSAHGFDDDSTTPRLNQSSLDDDSRDISDPHFIDDVSNNVNQSENFERFVQKYAIKYIPEDQSMLTDGHWKGNDRTGR